MESQQKLLLDVFCMLVRDLLHCYKVGKWWGLEKCDARTSRIDKLTVVVSLEEALHCQTSMDDQRKNIREDEGQDNSTTATLDNKRSRLDESRLSVILPSSNRQVLNEVTC